MVEDCTVKGISELIKSDPLKAAERFVECSNSVVDFPEIEKLLEVGKSLLDVFDKMEDSGVKLRHQKGRVLGTIGNLYYSMGKLDEAEESYMKALQVYLELSKEDGSFVSYVGGALYNLGNLYQVRRKFEEAEKAYLDAIRVFEVAGDKNEQIAAVLVSLGTMYAKIGEYERAEKYLIRAFEIKREIGADARELGVILNNLAVIYLQERRRREAEILLRKALEIFEGTEFTEEFASVVQNLISFVNPEDVDDAVLEKLRSLANISPDLSAKVEFIRAKKLERFGKTEEAGRSYLRAGCLSFIAYRNFGMQSVNFVHCFEKAEELGIKEITPVKSAILRFYMGASVSVSVEELERIGEGNDLLAEVARTVLHDSGGI